MDTRFWGPSGWRLLHLMTFTYEPKTQRKAMGTLFHLLPFVLPCKYCRSSLTEYLQKESLEEALVSREALAHWLYRVHNHVNAKLRGQGLTQESDPSFEAVCKVYEDRVAAGCVRTEFEGWDFLFSLAENHPLSHSGRNSAPMNDAPAKAGTAEERNYWNLMRPEERMKYYVRFWSVVGPSLPFEEWRTAWADCGLRKKALQSRAGLLKELYRIRCCIEKKLELVNREQFDQLCKRLQEHRSGCGRNTRSRTCRRVKTGPKTRKV
jgi:hypothetical protein